MTPDQLYIVIGSIVGPITVVGVALAILILRVTSSLDRRIESDKAAADANRRAYQAAADANRRAFQARADAFRAEMQRLAERRSHVEGRGDGRGAAAG